MFAVTKLPCFHKKKLRSLKKILAVEHKTKIQYTLQLVNINIGQTNTSFQRKTNKKLLLLKFVNGLASDYERIYANKKFQHK